MRLVAIVPSIIALLSLATLPTVEAQDPDTIPDTRQGTVWVYLDCVDFFCDRDFIRTEIDWVNYVRNRQDADVHILITTQRTAAGGEEFTVAFLGRGRFLGIDQELVYTSEPNASDDDERRGLTRVIKLGLVRYVSQTPLADGIEISFTEPEGKDGAATAVDDPWNFWTFRVSGRGFFRGESSFSSSSLSGSFSADRVTEEWKIETGLSTGYSERRFELSNEETVTSIQRSYGANALVVRSVSPHWSAGGGASASSSTRFNQDYALRLAPAIEYNIFPYSESTRRQLTFRYSVGVTSFDYTEETIFEKTSETLLDQTLITSLSTRQPWGSISASLDASQYLHDLSKYGLGLFSSLEINLLEGLSLDLFGDVRLIRNQLYLPLGGATDEEILLRQRQLATDYNYFASIGLSYRFGSPFANVVNPRFEGSSGGVIFIN